MTIFEGTNVESYIVEKLERAGLFTYKRIVELSELELQKLTCLNSKDCQKVQVLASKLFLNRIFLPVPQVAILNENRRITFDCSRLNKLLGGGIPLRGITELYGESGAGKTQICLQLSITVQYPLNYGGLAMGAVYICTEDKFPSNRLNQMVKHFPRNVDLKDQMSSKTFGDKIYVDHIADIDGLKECLFHRLPRLLSSCPVGIIIIDSIAAIYRTEYSFRQTIERAKSIREMALQLHKINRKYKTAILCINQVSDSMDNNQDKVAALGLAWANMVTTKLKTYRYPKRALKVETAPDLPSNFCYYGITDKGVFGTDIPTD